MEQSSSIKAMRRRVRRVLKLSTRSFRPLLSLNAVKKPRLVIDWHRRNVWTAEEDGLDPWDSRQDRVPCRLEFATHLWGWKMPCAPFVPTTAKYFVNTLRAISNESPLDNPNSADLLDSTWWFDVSSRTKQAFYQLSTAWTSAPQPVSSIPVHGPHGPAPRRRVDYTLSFSVIVFCENMNAVVVKRIQRTDRKLYAIARMCCVPLLEK